MTESNDSAEEESSKFSTEQLAALSDLESLLEEATTGDEGKREAFFRALLETHVIVPRREQKEGLTDLANYGEALLDVLALKIEGLDEVGIVPVFTSESEVEAWCGLELNLRIMPAKQLIELLPESWELSLNPGGEFGKDFSSWELSKLRQGPDAIAELLEDLAAGEDPGTLEVQTLDLEEIPGLEQALKELHEGSLALSAVFFIKQFQGDGSFNYMLGVRPRDSFDREQAEATIEAKLHQLFVGRENCILVALPEQPERPVEKLLALVPPAIEFS